MTQNTDKSPYARGFTDGFAAGYEMAKKLIEGVRPSVPNPIEPPKSPTGNPPHWPTVTVCEGAAAPVPIGQSWGSCRVITTDIDLSSTGIYRAPQMGDFCC